MSKIAPKNASVESSGSLLQTEKSKPTPMFLQIADVQTDSACVWVWHPSPDALSVSWSYNQIDWHALLAPLQCAESGWTWRSVARKLPSNSVIVVKVESTVSKAVERFSFKTPPLQDSSRALRFGWGGDICGQGYGRHVDKGLPIFKVLSQQKFDFFLVNGDLIYADHDISAIKTDLTGNHLDWPNALDNPYAEAAGYLAHQGAASTLDEFRSKYLYLWADDGFKQFLANTPMLYVLDDHEVRNNWTRDTVLPACRSGAPHLADQCFDALKQNALQVWNEFAPSSTPASQRAAPGFKVIHHGYWLDIFVVDARSQRGANSNNLQPFYGVASHWLGPKQLHALTQELQASKAVWKLLVSGTPLSTLIPDADTPAGPDGAVVWDGVANGDHGAPAGREVELALLLASLHDAQVENLVVISGDVHFASAVHYDPQRAAFSDFSPFWEFINGPLHAGGFPAKGVDRTFGARQEFVGASLTSAAPPGPNCSSFGSAQINSSTGDMTVSLHNDEGLVLFSQVLSQKCYVQQL